MCRNLDSKTVNPNPQRIVSVRKLEALAFLIRKGNNLLVKLLLFLSGAVWFALGSPALSAQPSETPVQLPPAATHVVRFTSEIQPIFETACLNCHGYGRAKGGFRLDNRAALLEGGDSGPAVAEWQSAKSLLVELVAGLDPDRVMPKKGKRLAAAQISALRAWIDQGMPWDERISFAKKEPQNMTPSKPSILLDDRTIHPLDALLDRYCTSNQISLPAVVAEPVYARRAHLDLVGLLPERAVLEEFEKSTHTDKRRELARFLLADIERFAQHWLSFWNDLLRNDYRGTGYIDGGRKQITSWLYNALLTNMPYDQFVAELVNPSPESEGFVKGIVWRGVVNSSQTPEMQAAQNVSQVFMGVNLKCASCHDSFVNQWRLSDAYSLAAVFSEEPLEMFECDKATGQTANPGFIYPALGVVDAAADLKTRQAQLASLITGPKDGRLPRTIVNRLWARFFGRGLVEPVDDMEQPPWSADILDWLAEDLVDHGYDLKRTMEMIVTSRAYQLPAVDPPEMEAGRFVFRGPMVRRLSAEQFRDAVAQLTGQWYIRSAYPGVAGPVRASLVPPDSLTVAMGRPNREHVVTARQNSATMLQALELTNGKTLAELLKHGAARLGKAEPSLDSLAAGLFADALGRKPTRTELDLLRGHADEAATPQQIQDLFWAVTMLPEFQLIY